MLKVFFEYLKWHYLEISKGILAAWQNYLKFYLNYYSIPLLLKTLFSPWRNYRWVINNNFVIQERIEVFVSNLISRLIGAMMRIFLIVFGFLIEITVIAIGLILFLFWLFLPLIMLIGFIYGLQLLF